MNLHVYNGTIFFQASLLIRILRQFSTKMSHVTKMSRYDEFLSEPTTDVNGNKLASLKKEARRGQHHCFQIVYRL